MADEDSASASALADSKKSEGEYMNVCNCNFCFCLLLLILFVCNCKALMQPLQICRPKTVSPRKARDRRVTTFNVHVNLYLCLLLKLFVSCHVCTIFNFCFCLLLLILFVCNCKALMQPVQICRPKTASPRTARDRRVIMFNVYINVYLCLLLKLFVSCHVCTIFNFCFCLLLLILFVCNCKALMQPVQICRPKTASPRTARDRRVIMFTCSCFSLRCVRCGFIFFCLLASSFVRLFVCLFVVERPCVRVFGMSLFYFISSCLHV